MKVNYRTKEESKRAQELRFLSLSPQERLYEWLKLMYQSKKLLPRPKNNPANDNFEIVIQVEQE